MLSRAAKTALESEHADPEITLMARPNNNAIPPPCGQNGNRLGIARSKINIIEEVEICLSSSYGGRYDFRRPSGW